MKTVFKKVLGVAAIVVISSTVSGVTTCMATQTSAAGEKALADGNETGAFAMRTSYNPISGQPVDLTEAAEKSVHAVVHIKSTENSKTTTVEAMPDLFDFFFGNGQGRQQQVQTQPRVGFGSGVILSADGYIVTNNHVIDGADEISVTLNDNREFKGRLIGTDPSTDLALVKIDASDLPYMTIGNSDDLKVGEWILAVGNPFNLTSTVTAGIVSAKARNLGVYSSGIESFIQTDAAINQGNSGGALVNARGELVGINAILSSPTGTYAGYGFAIPTSIMTKVVSDLKQYGVVQRAVLGIKGGNVDDELNKQKDLGTSEGVYVSEVTNNSGALDAGIKVGDVITGIDGKSVKSMPEMQEIMAKHKPGDKVKVQLLRDKKDMEVEVTAKNTQGSTSIVKNADLDVLGATFKEIDAKAKKDYGLNNGLIVSEVNSGLFQKAGIKKGFVIIKVNNQDMTSVDDLQAAVKEAGRSADRVLFIKGLYPSGRITYYSVDLSQE